VTRAAQVTDADVRAAQAALDAWSQDQDRAWLFARPGMHGALLQLRTILAGWSADVRAAGYLEGVQEGRREAACLVLDALRGEGLAL
jgi:hypothetical protein